MSTSMKSNNLAYDFELTETTETISSGCTSPNIKSTLTISENEKSTTVNYRTTKRFNEGESGEMVKEITWQDVFTVLSSGKYLTAQAIADELQANVSAVNDILKRHKDQLHSPKHRSHRSGDVFYVLANRRNHIYETLRPIQNAMRQT